MKDLDLFSLDDLSELVRLEGSRQVLCWGIQDRTPFEWMAFLTEEIGELAAAISEHHYRVGSRENVVKEAIQSATLCLKIAEMYENATQSRLEK